MTTKELLERLDSLRETEFVSTFVEDIGGFCFEKVGESCWYKVETFLGGEWYCYREEDERFKYCEVFKLV